MDDDYRLVERLPTVEEHRRLRITAGLTPRSVVATRQALPNSLLSVVIEQAGEAVAMGRVVGDGGLFFHMVDVAVDPRHQGRGLGKRIVAELVDRLRAIAPAEAYVSLIANGDAKSLYAQFGFETILPHETGMTMWLNLPSPATPQA